MTSVGNLVMARPQFQLDLKPVVPTSSGTKRPSDAGSADHVSKMKRQGAIMRPCGFKRLREAWSSSADKEKGGFLEFQAKHPSLCETKTSASLSSGNYKCPPLTSMSQPCLPVANVGPTKVLPFLYLGSQTDALSQDTLQQSGINYVLNVSNTCPKPPFIQEGHFLRIPVNDNYCDKLLPFFQDAFQFIDKVREANGSVLVHCLAGISRSPTLAIAYIMRHLGMSTDDTYRYVKDKRPTISPNFNFLGQLMEYEKQLKEGSAAEQDLGAAKKLCLKELCSPTSPTVATPKFLLRPSFDVKPVQSPTTALANLSFGAATPESATPTQEKELPFPQFPTTSLDKLSFMPCFAIKEEVPIGAKSSTSGATKRPLSIASSAGLASGCSGSKESSGCSAGQGNTVSGTVPKVTLRSPEMKAKRPTVRPNSIAFSSYPKFDFSSDTSDAMSFCVQNLTPDLQHSAVRLRTRHRLTSPSNSPDRGSSSNARKVRADQATMRSIQFEQGRKSRSLEDILNSPEREASSCTSCGGLRQHSHAQCAAEMFTGLENMQCHCYGASDPHQSSSSISSSGSHNSLHGSLEIIQVS